MLTLRFVSKEWNFVKNVAEPIFVIILKQRNEPELKFMIENGVPSVQFIGCENSSPIRVNIFDVVQVEVYAKDEKLKAKLVLPN